MDPTSVGRRSEAQGADDQGDTARAQGGPMNPPREPGEPEGRGEESRPPERQAAMTTPSGGQTSPLGDRLARLFMPDPSEAARALSNHAGSVRQGGQEFVYAEWDGGIQDYREGWCRVRERRLEEANDEFAAGVRATYGPMIRLLRRYFEGLRPADWRRLRGQLDGEEVDLDAAIRRVIDRRAGAEASDRLYLHRDKVERSVAAAFLVDLSGSTSRQLGHDARRIIDVEREGLVLLTEALQAIGDRFAVYGYSGNGRHEVDVWVLKDFDELPASRLAARVGALTPLQQNRDGAAIRHATRKLMGQDARIRLLVLLSDGRPLDDGYAGEYGLLDTRMALREARAQGIEPFCITVDRDAEGYLRRMYGEVEFIVIDRVETLPQRLPRIYRQLTA